MNEAERREAWIKFAAAALGGILSNLEAADLSPEDAAAAAGRYASTMLGAATELWGDADE